MTGSVLNTSNGKTDRLINEDDERRKHTAYPGKAIVEYSENLLLAKSESKYAVQSSKLLKNLRTNSQRSKSDHNKAAQLQKAKPKLNLKLVSEIIKPYTKTSTMRPHTFIRRPEITQIQQFGTPNRPSNSWQSMNIKTKVTSQENENTKFGKYSQENNQIVTYHPKPLTAASGLFKSPHTLLFGFKPMTTPASFPANIRPRTTQGRFHPPKNLGFIPATAEPNTYFRSLTPDGYSNKKYYSKSEPSSDSFFGKINNFFQPISKIFND